MALMCEGWSALDLAVRIIDLLNWICTRLIDVHDALILVINILSDSSNFDILLVNAYVAFRS